MGTDKNTYIAVGLAVILLLVVGFLSYRLGLAEGERGMHGDMMEALGDQEVREEVIDHKQMTMEQMTEGLDGLKGDAFDKAFVEMMIVHHQGAVDMAELINENAKHDELKKLGQDIIIAQTKEIAMMKQWLKDWGYENGDIPMMDHSMMKH